MSEIPGGPAAPEVPKPTPDFYADLPKIVDIIEAADTAVIDGSDDERDAAFDATAADIMDRYGLDKPADVLKIMSMFAAEHGVSLSPKEDGTGHELHLSDVMEAEHADLFRQADNLNALLDYSNRTTKDEAPVAEPAPTPVPSTPIPEPAPAAPPIPVPDAPASPEPTPPAPDAEPVATEPLLADDRFVVDFIQRYESIRQQMNSATTTAERTKYNDKLAEERASIYTISRELPADVDEAVRARMNIIREYVGIPPLSAPATPVSPDLPPADPDVPTPPPETLLDTTRDTAEAKELEEARAKRAHARQLHVQPLVRKKPSAGEMEDIKDDYTEAFDKRAQQLLDGLEAEGKLDEAPELLAKLLVEEKLKRAEADKEKYLEQQAGKKGWARRAFDKYRSSRKVRIGVTVALAATTLATGGATAAAAAGIKAGLRGATAYSAARAFQQNKDMKHENAETVEAAEKTEAQTAELAAYKEKIEKALEGLSPAERLAHTLKALEVVRTEVAAHLKEERDKLANDQKTLRKKRFIAGTIGVAAAVTPFAGHDIVGHWVGNMTDNVNEDTVPRTITPPSSEAPSFPDKIVDSDGVPINPTQVSPGEVPPSDVPSLNPDDLLGKKDTVSTELFEAGSGDSIWSAKEAAVNGFFDQIKDGLKVPGLSADELKQWQDMSAGERKELRTVITDRLKDRSLSYRGGDSLVEVGDSINTTPEQFANAMKFALKQRAA